MQLLVKIRYARSAACVYWGGGGRCVSTYVGACVPACVCARVMYVGVLFCNYSPVYVPGLIFIRFGPE